MISIYYKMNKEDKNDYIKLLKYVSLFDLRMKYCFLGGDNNDDYLSKESKDEKKIIKNEIKKREKKKQ